MQDTQFDVDRWLLGILQAQTPVQVLEVPTIPGLLAGVFADRIDQGMRAGIPEEDWSIVVTLYDDAEPVAAFTGTTAPRNARVLLLDRDGVVRMFHDRGYSARVMLELDRRARAL